MSFAFKAKLLARQGQSPEQILAALLPLADAQITILDRRLARFVEESTPEQQAWLNEELGFTAETSEEPQALTPR